MDELTNNLKCRNCVRLVFTMNCHKIWERVTRRPRAVVIAYNFGIWHCASNHIVGRHDPITSSSSSLYCVITSHNSPFYFSPSRSSSIMCCTCLWLECCIQNSRRISHSSQNTCRVNDHTAWHIMSHQALRISNSCWQTFMQGGLMLIISHYVIKQADGITQRIHSTGCELHEAGAQW